MRYFLFATIIISSFACGSKSELSKQLSGSDSLAINFNSPGTNNIEKTVNTTDGKAIDKLIRFADGKAGKLYKCSYDGNLMFYKKGTLTGDISFNFSVDSCHHFIMQSNGDLKSMEMSNEAADFLKSLSEGKNWY